MSEADEVEPGPFALWVRRALGGWLLGPYLRFVRATSRYTIDPPDFWERMEKDWPVLFTAWHGQCNLIYPTAPDPRRVAIMISTHADGNIAQGIAASFGYTIVKGSGASERQRHGTGGVAAFRQTLRVLAGGQSTVATADIPPIPGRNVSRGLIAMARRSKRPIVTFAISSSRRTIIEKLWDKMQFHFPFSHVAFVGEGPFFMGDEAQEEADAAMLHDSLDRVLEKSLKIADS